MAKNLETIVEKIQELERLEKHSQNRVVRRTVSSAAQILYTVQEEKLSESKKSENIKELQEQIKVFGDTIQENTKAINNSTTLWYSMNFESSSRTLSNIGDFDSAANDIRENNRRIYEYLINTGQAMSAQRVFNMIQEQDRFLKRYNATKISVLQDRTTAIQKLSETNSDINKSLKELIELNEPSQNTSINQSEEVQDVRNILESDIDNATEENSEKSGFGKIALLLGLSVGVIAWLAGLFEKETFTKALGFIADGNISGLMNVLGGLDWLAASLEFAFYGAIGIGLYAFYKTVRVIQKTVKGITLVIKGIRASILGIGKVIRVLGGVAGAAKLTKLTKFSKVGKAASVGSKASTVIKGTGAAVVGAKAAKAGTSAVSGGAKASSKALSNNVLSKADVSGSMKTSKIKKGFKIISKFGKFTKFIPIIGGIALTGAAALSAYNGWNNAKKILGVKSGNLKTIHRLAAAIGATISSLVWPLPWPSAEGVASLVLSAAGLMGIDTSLSNTKSLGPNASDTKKSLAKTEQEINKAITDEAKKQANKFDPTELMKQFGFMTGIMGITDKLKNTSMFSGLKKELSNIFNQNNINLKKSESDKSKIQRQILEDVKRKVKNSASTGLKRDIDVLDKKLLEKYKEMHPVTDTETAVKLLRINPLEIDLNTPSGKRIKAAIIVVLKETKDPRYMMAHGLRAKPDSTIWALYVQDWIKAVNKIRKSQDSLVNYSPKSVRDSVLSTKIGNASKTSSINPGHFDIKDSDVMSLAKNIWHEARGESLSGQIAVANVTMNRVRSKFWPNNVSDVVYQPKQFSWTINKKNVKPSGASWIKAKKIARSALVGDLPDVSNGATHYHTLAVNPSWDDNMTTVAKIGNHVFFRPDKVSVTKIAKASSAKNTKAEFNKNLIKPNIPQTDKADAANIVQVVQNTASDVSVPAPNDLFAKVKQSAQERYGYD